MPPFSRTCSTYLFFARNTPSLQNVSRLNSILLSGELKSLFVTSKRKSFSFPRNLSSSSDMDLMFFLVHFGIPSHARTLWTSSVTAT